MKAFAKITASRVKENNKYTMVGDLFIAKKEMFSVKDIEEVTSFVAEKMPKINNRTIWMPRELAHLFNNSISNAMKFMYILSCIQDENGRNQYELTHENGTPCIKYVGVDTAKLVATEEVTEEETTEEVADEVATDEVATDEVATDEVATDEVATDEVTEVTEEVATEVTEEVAEETTDEVAEETAEVEDAPFNAEEAKDSLMKKYTVEQLKDICESNDIKVVKKDKEEDIATKIVENLEPSKIGDLLGA